MHASYRLAGQFGLATGIGFLMSLVVGAVSNLTIPEHARDQWMPGGHLIAALIGLVSFFLLFMTLVVFATAVLQSAWRWFTKAGNSPTARRPQ
jgi:peptidoglycan biosynthesis protein MviN/MurJ (putative lipid II flippase)